MKTNIVPLVSASKVVGLVRELSADSSNVFVCPHARKAMKRRKITMEQVLRCLLHGTVTEPPYQDIKGDWRMRLEVMTAGRVISAVPCVRHLEGKKVIVITVF